MVHTRLTVRRWSFAAAIRCARFAALHLFWAAGGNTGLASSAGRDLADRRPGAFVAFGLVGVAAVLLAGVALIVLASSDLGSDRIRRVARVVMMLIGVALLLRALVVEIALATAPSLRASVGPHWRQSGVSYCGTRGSFWAEDSSSPRPTTYDVLVGSACRSPKMVRCIMFQLAVTWRHPDTRSIELVGLLTGNTRGWEFAYLRAASEVTDFQPFLGFADLERRYTSDTLFPLFAQRIMRPSRPDHARYLRFMALDDDASAWSILARSQGVRVPAGYRAFSGPRWEIATPGPG